MDREGKYSIDDKMTKEETEVLEAIRLEIGEMDLVGFKLCLHIANWAMPHPLAPCLCQLTTCCHTSLAHGLTTLYS